MKRTLILRVNTPGLLKEYSEIDKIFLPGVTGDMTILPNHSALISPLKKGVIEAFTSGDKSINIDVEHGLVVVDQDRVEVFMENRYDSSS